MTELWSGLREVNIWNPLPGFNFPEFFSTEVGAMTAFMRSERLVQAMREDEDYLKRRAERVDTAKRAYQYAATLSLHGTRASMDSHNTPTSKAATWLNRFRPIRKDNIETESQLFVQTYAPSPVVCVGDPTWFEAPIDQARKISHTRDLPKPLDARTIRHTLCYDFSPQAYKRPVRQLLISSDSVQPFFAVKSVTETNAVAEKYGVKDWISGVIRDGGQGVGDPLAADFVKQSLLKDLSQPGFANEGFVPTRTCAGTLQNLLDVDLPTIVELAGTGRDSLAADSMKQNLFKGLSQPGLAKTCAGMFHNLLLNVLLPMNALAIFSMALFASIPAKVGAIAPEAAIAPEGTLQAANSDSNSSNFAFGLVAAIGVLFTIFQVLISMKWTRRPSRTSPVSTESLNRETRTVQRWCKTECTVEIMVAHRVEEGV